MLIGSILQNICCKRLTEKRNSREIYQAFITATAWTYDFHPTERTLSQLHTEGFHLIRNAEASNAISQLEDQYKLFSPANTLFQNMQNDIDVAAYTFADPAITGVLFAKGFRNNKVFRLQLSDIPGTVTIKSTNRDTLTTYTNKLREYNFYLEAAIKADYTNLLQEINRTIDILSREYHLRNK